jgi:predicted kinase
MNISKEPNICIILRGLPGSGKSTIAELLACEDDVVISMDNYWTRNGQAYKFDFNRIKEASQWTKEQFLSALRDKRELIVVDNTHTRIWEMAFFAQQAKRAGYQVHILHIERDIFDCFKDGKHSLRWDKMVEMADRWEPLVDRTIQGRLSRMEEEAANRLKNVDWSDD